MFRSKLEDLMEAEELPFPPTDGFGSYKPYLEHATAHPAKMNTLLLEFLVRAFSERNDTLLDPMAGSGSLGVVAALHQRNAVQVELEKKFWDWMEKAKENLAEKAYGRQLGWIKNICGDARKLSQLLGIQSDVAITSPPYASTTMTKKQGEFFEQMVKTVLPGRDVEKIKRRYESDYPSKENIGNLPLGDVDVCITSPPYADAVHGRGIQGREDYVEKMEQGLDARYKGKVCGNAKLGASLKSDYSKNPDNIANLPHGNIDAVITSPPYLKTADCGGGVNRQREGDVKIGCSTVGRTVSDPEALDNVKEYGDINVAEGLARNGKPTYLSEMLKVYAEMFRVLKPYGLAVIAIRPFVRAKRVVDLPYHTWLLMAKVGFRLARLYKLRLREQSFWRILYYQNHPEVPLIAHEYVIVAQKPDENGMVKPVEPKIEPAEFLLECIMEGKVK